jgi:uncharacterized tellurite resistance protein B-like protein
MTKTNYDVKKKALENGVRLFEIAQYCNISESCFNAHMRKPLSDVERQQFLEAVDAIANSKGE